MSLLLPMQHIHISAHTHHTLHTLLPRIYIFILHVHTGSAARALLEFSLIYFLVLCHCLFLYVRLGFGCSYRHQMKMDEGFIPERVGDEFTRFRTAKLVWSSVISFVCTCANENQVCLNRKETALVYNLCSVASYRILMSSKVLIIYCCAFMITSLCEETVTTNCFYEVLAFLG